MVKVEIRPIAGFEQEFENFNTRKQNLAVEIENAKQKATADVEARYADTNAKLDSLIAQVSEQVEVDVPDDAVAEETHEIVAEEQPADVENLGE